MAGIVATVIMFAILFTVGTSYFIFVNSAERELRLEPALGDEQGPGEPDREPLHRHAS